MKCWQEVKLSLSQMYLYRRHAKQLHINIIQYNKYDHVLHSGIMYTLGNVPHLYYLYDTYVIHMCCFGALHMYFIHLKDMCRTHVIHISHM